MDNKTSLFLALAIIGLFAADWFHYGWDLHIFLGREFLKLTEYVAFWR